MSYQAILAELLAGAQTTVIVSLGSWVLGIVLGMGLALLRGAPQRAVAAPTGFVITTLRSLPQLVVLYLIYFGLSATGVDLGSIEAAVIALGVIEAAFMAEYYRAGFLTVSGQQRDAGLSIGFSQFEVFRYVVIPQTIPFIIPSAVNSLVGLMKTATLASAVGAPEILYQGQQIYNRTGYIIPVALTIIVLYVVVTLPLTYVVSLLEQRSRSFRRARVL